MTVFMSVSLYSRLCATFGGCLLLQCIFYSREMSRYNIETFVIILVTFLELVLIANSVTATMKREIDLNQHLEYDCIHDKIAPEIKKAPPEQVSRKRRSNEEFEFTSTVVHVHPDPSITSNKDFSYLWTNETSPFWRALETVSKGLLVREGQPDNLIAISPTCEVFTSGENEGYCINGTLELECGIFSYPDNLSEQEYVCYSENGPCDFEGVEGPGVEANYILILGATDDEHCGDTVLGFASFCNLEYDFYRPINGYINICPKNIKSSDNIFKVDSIMYNLLLHELLHALGFSSSLYYFYEEENIVVEEQCGNEPAFGLETPYITEHVHSYFNCSEIDYAPLENYGSASASSHWEARVFNHEIMTAFISYDYQVFSNVTWHYFQDSQWYEVNYTYTNALDQFGAEWGKSEGCDIFTCNCSDYEYSCVGESQCTFDRIAKGSCSDTHEAFDDCDVVISDEHGSCLSSINYVNTTDDLFDLTQSYGRLSRCFDVRDTDDCSYLPACYETKMFKHLATNEYAYQVIGHKDYSDEFGWCYEGKHVEVGSDYVLCPNVEELLLHFDPSDIHDADTFVPPPLCHESCITCSIAHDGSKCLTCYSGDLTGPPPSPCNDTSEYQDIECVPVPIQLGCLPKFEECCTENCRIEGSNNYYCYCDVTCHYFGDCCHDIDETCPRPEESTVAQTSTETLSTSTASKSTSATVVSMSSSSQEMSSTSEAVIVVTTEVIATTVSQTISTTEVVETTSSEPTTEVIATTTKVTSSMREVPTTEIIAEATSKVISTTTSSESTIATTTKVISTTSEVVETTSSEQTTEVIAATTVVISSEASTEAIATTTKAISTTSEVVETTSSEQTTEIIATTTTPEVVETTSEQTTEVIVATTEVISTTSEVETTSSEQTTKIIATTTIPEVVETTLEQTTEIIVATTKVISTTSEVETTSSEPTTETIATTTKVISTTSKVVETTSPEPTTEIIATTTTPEVVKTTSEQTTEVIAATTEVIPTTAEVVETTSSESITTELPVASSVAPSLATTLTLITPSPLPFECANDEVRVGSDDVVELCVDRKWGSVCYDSTWDYRDAMVLCKQLDLPSSGAYVGWTAVSPDYATSHIKGVECTGEEDSLSVCPHSLTDGEPCASGQVAQAFCVEGISDCIECNMPLECAVSGISRSTYIEVSGFTLSCTVEFNTSRVDLSTSTVDDFDEIGFLTGLSASLLKQIGVIKREQLRTEQEQCEINEHFPQHGDPIVTLQEIGIETLRILYQGADGFPTTREFTHAELRNILLSNGFSDLFTDESIGCSFQHLLYWLTRVPTFSPAYCRQETGSNTVVDAMVHCNSPFSSCAEAAQTEDFESGDYPIVGPDDDVEVKECN